MLQRILGSRPYAPVAGLNNSNTKREVKRRAPISLIAAAAVCVVLCFFQLFIVFFQVNLADADEFDNDTRTAYTTGISILATFLAFFISTQVRNGWLRWIDYRLATENRASFRALDTSWRANLNFLSAKERLLGVATWPIQLLYVVMGLLAAAFISATTPTTAVAASSFGSWIPKGSDCSCAGSFAKQAANGQPAGFATGEATWSVSDSTFYAASNRSDSFRCPLSRMPDLMTLINNEAPQKMAYSVDGIAVQGSAVGAPEILFSAFYNTNISTAFRNVLSEKGNSLKTVSQCAPVLTKSPFKCASDPNGNTKVDMVGSTNFGTFSVSTNGCNYEQWYNGDLDNGTYSQLMSGQFCPGSTVGAGIMVIGGMNNAAVNLALMAGDLDWANANWQNTKISYTVRCEVDVPGAIGWRDVAIDLQNTPTSENPYGQVVSAGSDACDNKGASLDQAYAGTAAAVAGKVLADENMNIYFPKALITKALNHTGNHPAMYKGTPSPPSAAMMRSAPWAMSGSSNGLEDALGVTAGIVMSKMIAQNFTGNEDIGTVVSGDQNSPSYSSSSGDAVLPMLNLTGTAAVDVVRMGPGKPFAVIYAVPAAIVALAAVFLIVKVPWHREAKRTDSLLDIMGMGQMGIGEIHMGGFPVSREVDTSYKGEMDDVTEDITKPAHTVTGEYR